MIGQRSGICNRQPGFMPQGQCRSIGNDKMRFDMRHVLQHSKQTDTVDGAACSGNADNQAFRIFHMHPISGIFPFNLPDT